MATADAQDRDDPLLVADHLALPNAAYLIGALLTFDALTGRTPTALGAGFVAALAVAVYLLDRVKIRDTRFDPADRLAHPARHAFMRRHAGGVRILMVAAALVAAICGRFLSPWTLLLIPAAFVGVFLYARPRERGWRPKDVFGLKNLAVAASVTALAVATAWLTEPPRLADALPIGALLLIVFGDAAACDLDDVAGDRPFRTRTFVVTLGDLAAWRIIVGCHAIAAIASLIAAAASITPWAPAMTLGPGLLVVTLLIRAARPRLYRPVIDLRLAPVAIVALLLTS
ncbi:MAG: hypothetical protein RIB58_04455 [Phycisphaerales bacterium]